MTQSWNAMLMQMLWIVPIFLVCLFGLVLAISRWGRHPRAALLVTLGVSVLLVAAVCQSVVYTFIMPRVMAGHPAASASTIYGVVGFLFSLLHQSGLVLLILAAFAGRKPAAPPPLH